MEGMKKISKVKLLKSIRLNNECTLKEKWVVVPRNMSYPKKEINIQQDITKILQKYYRNITNKIIRLHFYKIYWLF